MSYDLVYPYDKVNDDDDKNHDDVMRLNHTLSKEIQTSGLSLNCAVKSQTGT